MNINDENLCKLAETFGARVAYANEPDEFYHLIEFTTTGLASMLAAQPAQVWQPIETAPKDGTTIDLWTDDGRYSDCFWGVPHHECGEAGGLCDSDWHSLDDGWVWAVFNEPLDVAPSHWMRTPERPIARTENGGGQP